MLRLLIRGIFVVFVFSFSLFGIEDFERICDEEVLKKDFDFSIIQNSCLKTAEKYEEENDTENASWYYLLSKNLNQNLENQEDINSSFLFYINQGHTYVLTHHLNKAKIAYENVLTFDINVNKELQRDYTILKRLYPNKKKQLKEGLKIWNSANAIFLQITKLTKEYEKLYDKNHYDLMIKKFNAIIKLKNKTILNQSSSIMLDYYNLALIHEERKHYQKSIDNYLQSLQIAKNILPKGHLHIGTIYNSLGLLHNDVKEYKKAEKYYFKALDIYLKEVKEDDDLIAVIYNNLATIYGDNQAYDNALLYYNKALKIEKKNHSKNIVNTYYNIGLLYQQMKSYDNVLPTYKKVIPFIKDNSLKMATYHSLLAAYYQEVEENEYALFYYKEALKTRKSILGELHPDTAESFNSLGSIYEALKDLEQALIFYEKALKINKILLDKNDNFIAISHNNIASIYTNLNKYEKAKINLLKTLKIKQNILKKNDIDFAVTYTNLGFIEEKLKHYQIASKYYTQALSLYLKNKGEKSLEVSIIYNHIASLHKEQKEYYWAIEYLEKAKNIMDTILSKNHTEKSLIYNNLGLLYGYIDAYKKSYYYNLLSFQIFLNNQNKNFRTLDSKQKKKYINSFGNRVDNLFNSAILHIHQLPNIKDVNPIKQNTLTHWLNYKGTIFNTENILSMVYSKTTNQTVKNNIDKLKLLTIQLDKLEHNYMGQQSYKDKKEKKEIKEQIHNLQIILNRQTPKFKNLLNLDTINIESITSNLKENELYIDFAKGEKSYYIFTLDNNKHITFNLINKTDTKEIEENIKAFNVNINEVANSIEENNITLSTKELKSKSQKILSTLYDKLFKKYLKEVTKNKDTLIISPDGMLNFLPFEALYHNNQYLIENYQVSYISSGRELIRQTKRDNNQTASKIVVFGSPDFWLELPKKESKKSQSKNVITNEDVTIFDINFSPLDISKKEIDTMRKYYPTLEVYQGKNATVENLFKVQSPKILHISTHGFFLNNEKNPNPMLASGLAFAGANYANYESDARGIATALKLSSLNLQSTKLVVLSACETGLGKIHQAEGITGLSKAFIQAGAQNVISTLWNVSAKKTVTLMQHFYENAHKKDNYATALHKAKLQMIHMHPYYWSAFIINGI
ncbi:MAG: Unknown protein [uncultured Sulfurovum sp.]|uniref:CHAT domain-containing protein n=1 Tax=uncultured Sulfurovum sp. TaxID=269237 RepID=A0A6S6S561_9BACT|nr:MAG: Unknown protein [uncultured Sulfurovum sp.]